MSIRFQPSKFGTSPAPDTQGYTPHASNSLVRGAVVTFNSGTDRVDEHAGGGVVTGILGVAGCDVNSGASDDPAGTLPVFKAKDQEFVGSALTGASAVATDLSGVSITDQYGVIKHTDDEWYVDLGDTSDKVVQITKIDDDLNLVWFRFLESAIQEV